MIVNIPEIHEVFWLDESVRVPGERVDRITLRADDPPKMKDVLFGLKKRLQEIF